MYRSRNALKLFTFYTCKYFATNVSAKFARCDCTGRMRTLWRSAPNLDSFRDHKLPITSKQQRNHARQVSKEGNVGKGQGCDSRCCCCFRSCSGTSNGPEGQREGKGQSRRHWARKECGQWQGSGQVPQVILPISCLLPGVYIPCSAGECHRWQCHQWCEHESPSSGGPLLVACMSAYNNV